MQHKDAHYCAASWKYLREYAIKHQELVSLVSLDDKHKIKCEEEPSYPVAAAERGKKVMVGKNQVMAVAGHDLTKFSGFKWLGKFTPTLSKIFKKDATKLEFAPQLGNHEKFQK